MKSLFLLICFFLTISVNFASAPVQINERKIASIKEKQILKNIKKNNTIIKNQQELIKKQQAIISKLKELQID